MENPERLLHRDERDGLSFGGGLTLVAVTLVGVAVAGVGLMAAYVAMHVVWLNSFWEPDPGDARRLVQAATRYTPPASATLIHSANYWGTKDARASEWTPRSMCFVYRYGEEEFAEFAVHRFAEDGDTSTCWRRPPRIPPGEGCADFRASAAARGSESSGIVMVERAAFCQGPRGARIFVDAAQRIVVFEPFLYD